MKRMTLAVELEQPGTDDTVEYTIQADNRDMVRFDLIRARNSHHAAEAIFKAAAVAFRTAARQSGVAGSVPSTKGMLA